MKKCSSLYRLRTWLVYEIMINITLSFFVLSLDHFLCTFLFIRIYTRIGTLVAAKDQIIRTIVYCLI